MPNDPFTAAMHAAGWIAQRTIDGTIAKWHHELSKYTWRDWEARAFWNAGDEPHTPPIRQAEGVT